MAGAEHRATPVAYGWLSIPELVRSNSRRFMPSQSDEEIHQLSYLQKHMANILTLLADSVEGEGDDSLVLTMETFEYLGFLVQFSEGTSLSQAATFFANSDPDMPAAPVDVAEHSFFTRSAAKESNQQTVSDLDVTMAEANTSHTRNSTPSSNPAYYRNVLNCHDSVIYILAPLKYATVYGCSDATIVLGAVGKVVKVEHCERVHIIAASKRICIANCHECIFYLGVNHQPLVLGDNHNLQVAPFNTCYPQLRDHLMQVGVDPSVNKWDQPFVLGVVDPHDSLSHPAGVSDVKAESATCLDPDLFTNFLVPSWFGDETQEPTNCNPFPLPEIYGTFQSKKHSALEDIQKTIWELQLDENRKRDLATALHAQFKGWN
uniref:TBCC domain-containing protein 1 n=1 Tax=Oryza rufipogon TaxID=4529 RepID=A0A0E0R5P0_ORYRU